VSVAECVGEGRRRIGLVSDTHGLLRPEVVAYLTGCEHIIHAGDIGDPAILSTLAELAPLTAVRGNNDRGPWAMALPEQVMLEFDGVRIHVLHDLADRGADPAYGGAGVVVCGHSHKPEARSCEGVLVVNPGSAGPRRFRLPISAGELWIEGGSVRAALRTFEPN